MSQSQISTSVSISLSVSAIEVIIIVSCSETESYNGIETSSAFLLLLSFSQEIAIASTIKIDKKIQIFIQ